MRGNTNAYTSLACACLLPRSLACMIGCCFLPNAPKSLISFVKSDRTLGSFLNGDDASREPGEDCKDG